MRGIRKFIKSISGHKNFDPNYYSSEVSTMTNLVYSLFNFDFIFERQKKNGYGANKYRFFWGKIRGVVSYTLYITTDVASSKTARRLTMIPLCPKTESENNLDGLWKSWNWKVLNNQQTDNKQSSLTGFQV